MCVLGRAGGGGGGGGWKREGEARSCEIMCVWVCVCMDAAEEEEGQSEICNALLN